MLQPCPSSPEISTASSGRECLHQDDHCRVSTGRARCRSARDPGTSRNGMTTQVTFTRFDRYWGRGPVARPARDCRDGRTARQVGSLARWGLADRSGRCACHELRELGDATGTLHPVPAASVMFAAFNFANPNQPAWEPLDRSSRQTGRVAGDQQRTVCGRGLRWVHTLASRRHRRPALGP